jgi:prepilin-type processing-associated H-X9-DG protein
MDAVYPYVKNEQVFTCPSDGSTRKNYIYYQRLPKASTDNWGSYLTNTAYWDPGPGQSPSSDISSRQTVTISMVQRPAETVWALDGNGAFQVAWPNIAQEPKIKPGPPRTLGFTGGGGPLNEGAIVERHQGRVNVVWADGHATSANLDHLTEQAIAGPTKGAYRFFTIDDD